MKLRAEQLSLHLEGHLLPIYVLSGDEPLQMMECTDAIIAAAYQRDYLERDILSVEQGLDWGQFNRLASERSLFSKRQIVDLRLPNAKPGKQGATALKQWAKHPPDDKILLLRCGRIERSRLRSAWLKALEKAGVFIQLWSLSPAQTLNWVRQRLQNKGFHADTEAVRLLTERVEGNLLAAAQEIEKLSLLLPPGKLSVREIMVAVMDSSRFSIFDLSDAMLAANQRRTIHILRVLQEEGSAISLVLWALAEQLRQLHDFNARIAMGMSADEVLASLPAWRQRSYRTVLKHSQQIDWSALLQACAQIDRMSKGQNDYRIRDEQRLWDELQRVLLTATGVSLAV